MSVELDTRESVEAGAVQLGDFFEWSACRKRKWLTECPICALDPLRERHVFEKCADRDDHFFDEHDQDDIGRPMSELLPEAGGRR